MKEVRFSYKDFCEAAIARLKVLHPEVQFATKVEYIKKYAYEPEGRYENYFEVPDEVCFIMKTTEDII